MYSSASARAWSALITPVSPGARRGSRSPTLPVGGSQPSTLPVDDDAEHPRHHRVRRLHRHVAALRVDPQDLPGGVNRVPRVAAAARPAGDEDRGGPVAPGEQPLGDRPEGAAAEPGELEPVP